MVLVQKIENRNTVATICTLLCKNCVCYIKSNKFTFCPGLTQYKSFQFEYTKRILIVLYRLPGSSFEFFIFTQ